MSGAIRIVVGALATAAVAGCARPAPPMLTLTGRNCDAAPALGAALPVPFGDRTGAEATLGNASPCLDAGNGRTVTYAVFTLPDAPAPYLVTITSQVAGHAVIFPRASVLDGSSRLVRSIAGDDFRPTLTGFTAGLRTQPGERVLVVSADPATVGQNVTLRLSARDIGTQVAAAVFVPIIVVPVAEQARQNAAVLSLNGTVRVTARPIPIAD